MGLSQISKDRESEIIAIMEASLPALRAFARGLCGNKMMADDLLQSACERALLRLEQVTDLSGVKSWLNRIVYTQWQDVLRKRTRRNTNLLHLGEYRAATGSFSHDNGEEKQIAKLDIENALAYLSPEHRVAVVLVSMLGYNYQEASVILEVPVGTLASRVARARLLLAGYLEPAKETSDKTIFLSGRLLDDSRR
jgi:RNA polymerase sigma-70 factor (ECF subfamily)